MRFEPVFSFYTGKVYGFRVECSLQIPEFDLIRSKPDDLVQLQNSLWERIFSQWRDFHLSGFLFLPVNVSIIQDPLSTIDAIRAFLRKFGFISKNIIFDVTDRVSFHNRKLDIEKMKTLQSSHMLSVRNLDIACLEIPSLLSIHPDFVQIDLLQLPDIHKHDIYMKTLEVLLDLALKMEFHIITKNLVNRDDLQALLKAGVQFGYGPLLESSGFGSAECIHERIHTYKGTKNERNLGNISRIVKTVDKGMTVAEVAQYFKDHDLETGVVVVSDNEPIGLVMREKLFQRLAFKYGYSLYWNREISILMDKEPLVLEAETALETVSRLSMERHRDQVYDLVIITAMGKLIGAVTIKEKLSKELKWRGHSPLFI